MEPNKVFPNFGLSANFISRLFVMYLASFIYLHMCVSCVKYLFVQVTSVCKEYYQISLNLAPKGLIHFRTFRGGLIREEGLIERGLIYSSKKISDGDYL